MKYLKLILLCLSVFFCFSCASHGPTLFAYVDAPTRGQTPVRVIPIWIDQDFGAADQVSLQAAIDQWNYALNGYILLEVKSTKFDMSQDSVLQDAMAGKAWVILKVDGNNAFIQSHDRAFGHPGYLILACTDRIGGGVLYIIRDRLVNSQVSGVAMHEMGHLLGAEHQAGGLMDPMPGEDNSHCIDKLTLEAVAYYQHLDYHKMNYCIYYDEKSRGL